MDAASWVIALSAAVQALAILSLVGITWYYAVQTRRQADELVRQRNDAERPVISLWLDTDESKYKNAVILCYRNDGVGPALNIECELRYPSGTILGSFRRVALGHREGKQKHKFILVDPTYGEVLVISILPSGQMEGRSGALPGVFGGDLPSVVARYEDVFGNQWQSSLPLVNEQSILGNGDLSVKEVAEKEQP